MNDKYIIEFFKQFKKVRWDRIKYKYNDIYNYLINRFNDSESCKESYYRIINNLEIRPVCKICGNKVRFNSRKGIFENTCSKQCTNKLRYESIKKFNVEHYGVENYYSSNKFKQQIKEYNIKNFNVEHTWQRNDIREKIKQTNIERYGVENGGGSKQAQEKIKRTTFYHYGVECSLSSPEIREKIKQTNLERYGVENILNSLEIQNKIKQTNLERYGVDNWQKTIEAKKYMSNKISSKEIQNKINNTKRKNHTFNTSKDEKYILEKLNTKFNNIIYQYKEERYPFKCDFYIKDLDMFIEYNGTWTHGQHLFDNTNINDINKLNKWKEKSINYKYYKTAIYVWTELDIQKYNIAKENKLNYKVFYNINDFNEWFENL